MKARLIRGMSKLPERMGLVTDGKVLGHDIGHYPVVCPQCRHPSLWIMLEHKEYSANVCQHCKSVRVFLDAPAFNMAASAVRVERYAIKYSSNLKFDVVESWLIKNVVNQRYVSYLGLGSGRIVLRIGGNKVSTEVYQRMLRFVMFNCMPRDQRSLNMLTSNMVDTSGAILLNHSQEYINIFGAKSHNERVTAREMEAIYNRPPLDDQDIRNISAIFSLYGIDEDVIDNFRSDFSAR